MTMLTKIGNSKGIRIPKAIIEQAKLDNTQIDLEVVENGLLLKPIKTNPRENWQKSIQNTLDENENKKDDAIIYEFLNDTDLEDFQW